MTMEQEEILQHDVGKDHTAHAMGLAVAIDWCWGQYPPFTASFS